MTIDRTDPYTRLNPRPIPTEDYTREETYRHTRVPVDLAVTLIPDAYTLASTSRSSGRRCSRRVGSSWVSLLKYRRRGR